MQNLTTTRLALRPVQADDVDGLWPYVSDPELPRFMTWDAHTNRQETAAFIEHMTQSSKTGSEHAWTVRHRGEVCAFVGLHQITKMNRAWRQDCATLGYWCAPPFQGRGFITEAASAVVRFAFTTLALHKVSVGCITDNVASRRVIEKLGFVFVGEQRDHMFRHGRWWNHLWYEMLVDDESAQRHIRAR